MCSPSQKLKGVVEKSGLLARLVRISVNNKGFIVWKTRDIISYGRHGLVQSGQESAFPSARIAYHSAGFGSSHIIRVVLEETEQ